MRAVIPSVTVTTQHPIISRLIDVRLVMDGHMPLYNSTLHLCQLFETCRLYDFKCVKFLTHDLC